MKRVTPNPAVPIRPRKHRQQWLEPLHVMKKPIFKQRRVARSRNVVCQLSVKGVRPVPPGSQNARRKAFLVQPVGLPQQEIVVCPPQHTHTQRCSFSACEEILVIVVCCIATLQVVNNLVISGGPEKQGVLPWTPHPISANSIQHVEPQAISVEYWAIANKYNACR